MTKQAGQDDPEADRWAGIDAWDRCVLSLPLEDGWGLATTVPDWARLDEAVTAFEGEPILDDRYLTAILSVVPPAAARCFAEAIGWALTLPKGAIRRLGPYLAGINKATLAGGARLSLRDGIGWAVVAGFESGAMGPRAGSVQAEVDRAGKTVQTWAAAGLVGGRVKDGWVYAAAGLTPAETLLVLDDGSVTEADARALAALRGVPLPTFPG